MVRMVEELRSFRSRHALMVYIIRNHLPLILITAGAIHYYCYQRDRNIKEAVMLSAMREDKV